MTKQEMGQELIKAWREVFKSDDITEESNFFEMGGDSVKAVQIVTWLLQKGIKLEIMKIFSASTVKEQMDILEETAPIVPVQPGMAMDGQQQMMMQPQMQQQPGAPQMQQQLCTPQMQQQPGAPQMQQQLCTPQMQQQPGAPQMQQQLCTPQMQQQQGAPQMQQQLCTPQMQQQLCTPQMQQQLCTPQMQPQLCTPEQLAAQQQMMMQPQMPQQSGLLKGLQYAAAPVENPVIVDINKPKLGEKVNSPEKALAIVLQSIVGRPVQESENFFAIGLTSVNVMQMITRCGEQGYQVTMQDVISNPTITELAKKLAAE
nr:acyl carrier protein [Sporomusa ovata]EQB28922.1 hypothetical protein SOV_1c06480 [Sporomusa ovata DSM 2662]